MIYSVSEKFKSLQGEGLFAGTPMAFIRLQGCSIGKRVCAGCDTDFEVEHGWRGGGPIHADELAQWSLPYKHVCLTGGEPLDRDLRPLMDTIHHRVLDPMTTYYPTHIHLETSGTIIPPMEVCDGMWICVSPKPGWKEEVIAMADEIKVIVPGLGKGEGWPTIEDAIKWEAQGGRLVFLQPRNTKFGIDQQNLMYVLDLLKEYPQFRLSTQAHKILKVQ